MKLFQNFRYVKCFKTDLIINSESGLALKVMGLKSEVWGFADVFITASDNCHGSHPVSFLYLLYNLVRILSVKTLGNPLNLARFMLGENSTTAWGRNKKKKVVYVKSYIRENALDLSLWHNLKLILLATNCCLQPKN